MPPTTPPAMAPVGLGVGGGEEGLAAALVVLVAELLAVELLDVEGSVCVVVLVMLLLEVCEADVVVAMVWPTNLVSLGTDPHPTAVNPENAPVSV